MRAVDAISNHVNVIVQDFLSVGGYTDIEFRQLKIIIRKAVEDIYSEEQEKLDKKLKAYKAKHKESMPERLYVNLWHKHQSNIINRVVYMGATNKSILKSLENIIEV